MKKYNKNKHNILIIEKRYLITEETQKLDYWEMIMWFQSNKLK